MLHSLVIGITMAVSTISHFSALLPAIVFHQTFEGLALGVRLASVANPSASSPTFASQRDDSEDDVQSETGYRSTSPSTSSPTLAEGRSPSRPPSPTRTQRILPPLLAILFAIPIPLIILVSLLLPSSSSSSGGSNIHPFSFSSPESIPTPLSILSLSSSSQKSTFQGVSSAISAGLLIYVSCVELMAGDFIYEPHIQNESPWKQTGALLALVGGALGMGAIG